MIRRLALGPGKSGGRRLVAKFDGGLLSSDDGIRVLPQEEEAFVLRSHGGFDALAADDALRARNSGFNEANTQTEIA